MKIKAVITILLISILCGVNSLQADTVWDINEDTDIYSGFYPFINIYDTPLEHTTVNIYGGSSDFISTFDLSILNIYGGNADIGAFEESIINMYGGNIGYIAAYNYSVINFFSSDDVTALSAKDFSAINVIGGYIGNLHAYNSSVIFLKGGNVSGDITARDFSTINIYGYDLFKTNTGGEYGYGQVFGFLTDDTYICTDLFNPEAYEHINLIPETTTIFFLVLGGIFIRKRT